MTAPQEKYFLSFNAAISHITRQKTPGRNMGGYVDFLYVPFLISVIEDLVIIYHIGPGRYEPVVKNIQAYSLITKKDIFDNFYHSLFFNYLPAFGIELVVPDVTMPILHIFSPWRFAKKLSSTHLNPNEETVTALVRLIDGSRCLLSCRDHPGHNAYTKYHFFHYFLYPPIPTSLIYTEYPVATFADEKISIHFPTPRKLRNQAKPIQSLPSLDVVYGYHFAVNEAARDTEKRWFLVMRDGAPLMVEQQSYCILGVYFSYAAKYGQTLKRFVPIPLTFEDIGGTRASTLNKRGIPPRVPRHRKNNSEKDISAQTDTTNPSEEGAVSNSYTL